MVCFPFVFQFAANYFVPSEELTEVIYFKTESHLIAIKETRLLTVI